jgi:undecaprenyl-diphosphatase
VSLAQAFLLATVQGVSEFLPISSSGHLGLLHRLLQIREAPATFTVLAHSGTLLAVLTFFRVDLIKSLKTSRRTLLINVFIASLPAAILGLFLSPFLNQILASTKVIALGFAITGLLLCLIRRLKLGPKNMSQLSPRQSLIIGLFQASALIPGLSRSGATIFAGQYQGLDPVNTLTFSFVLFIPATFGASWLTFSRYGLTTLSSLQILVGLFVPFLVGYLSLAILKRFLCKNKLYLLSPYCLSLSIFSLFV